MSCLCSVHLPLLGVGGRGGGGGLTVTLLLSGLPAVGGDAPQVLGRLDEGHQVLSEADLQLLVQDVPDGRASLPGLDALLVPQAPEGSVGVGGGVGEGEAARHPIHAGAQGVVQMAGGARVCRLARQVLGHVVQVLALVAVVARPVVLSIK